MKLVINDAKSATSLVLKYLEKNSLYKLKDIREVNLGRYYIAYGQGESPNVAITFKKAWFESFGEQGFVNDEGVKQTGIGDSINCLELKRFAKENVKRIFCVYKDGKIYTIKLVDALTKSHRWINKEGKEVRSFSIHNYTRLNPDVFPLTEIMVKVRQIEKV